MRDDHESALLFDGVDALLDRAHRPRRTLDEEADQVPLAGGYLDSRDHLQRAALLAKQFLDPPGSLDMVMVGDSDQRQSSPARRFDQPRWADPPVAEVGMHVQVGATARGGRFAALVVGHTASL